jgi:zinc transport system permease protein
MLSLFEPYLLRALLAGLSLAAVTGPLGCFIVWQRMAYFGDALSHSALLGIALGLAFHLPLQVGVLLVCAGFAVSILLLQRSKLLGYDTLLGILAHGALSFGLIGIALLPDARVDLHSLLFGDILAVRSQDLSWIAGGSGLVLGILLYVWSPLLLTIVNEDLGQAEGHRAGRLQGVLLACLALTVALAVQVVGVLLVTAMLIIPAASARLLSRSPEGMAAGAALIGMGAVSAGLYASVLWDIPTGPAMVAAMTGLFVVAAIARNFRHPRA